MSKNKPTSYSQIHILKRLLKESKQYYIKYIFLSILALVLSFVGVAEAEILRRMVNGATNLNLSLIITGGALFLGVLVIATLLDWYNQYLTADLNLKATYTFQMKVIDKLNRSKLPAYQKFHSGDLLSRVHDSVSAAQTGLNQQILQILRHLGTVIFLIIYLSILSWQLTLFTLLFAGLVPIVVNLLSNKIRENYDQYQKETAEYQAFLQESFQGAEVIKSFSLLSLFKQKFKEIYARIKYTMKKITLYESTLNQTAMILMMGGMLFVLAYGGHLVFQGELDLGAVLAFIVSFEVLVQPLSSLFNSWPQLQQTISAGKRVYDLLDLEEEEKEITQENQTVIKSRSKLEFMDVSYRYDSSSKMVINKLDLTFESGRQTAIVGPSGGGKSTIVKLLMQFDQPIEGKILYNQLNINEIPLGDWRDNIAYVSQDTTLFTDTIFNNIQYGNKKASKEAIIQAAKSASIHDDIINTPNGYQTMLDEDGLNLSGGQRQRIALARALVRKPLIYIFDEPTSSLDGATERHFTETLNNIMQTNSQSMFIIISHRLETIKNADYIYVLKDGNVVEEGHHTALEEQEELYYDFMLTGVDTGGALINGNDA